jgi:hypothetical protein
VLLAVILADNKNFSWNALYMSLGYRSLIESGNNVELLLRLSEYNEIAVGKTAKLILPKTYF